MICKYQNKSKNIKVLLFRVCKILSITYYYLLLISLTNVLIFIWGFVSGVTNKPNQKSMTFVSLGKS